MSSNAPLLFSLLLYQEGGEKFEAVAAIFVSLSRVVVRAIIYSDLALSTDPFVLCL